MKKYLIDFWFYDSDYSKNSRRNPIFTSYRPNMFVLGFDHRNMKSTPFTLIGEKESINPGFKGLIMIESDFDLKPDFCVYFNEGERQIGQGIILFQIEDDFLKEIKDCEDLKSFEFLNDDELNFFHKDQIELFVNIMNLNCKILFQIEDNFISTFFIKTNEKTNYKNLMLEIFNLCLDEFFEIQTNIFRCWKD